MMKKKNSRYLRLGISRLVIVSAMVCSSYSQPVLASSHKELSAVKNEISRQQNSLVGHKKTLNSLQHSLRTQELSISRLTREIKQTRAKLATANSNIQRIEQKIQRLEQQKLNQSRKLSELLQTYYVMNRDNSASPIFNESQEADRMSQYFQFLAKQRADTITELEQTKHDLESNQKQLVAQKSQIAALLNQQTDKLSKLKRTQTKRKHTLGKISKSISSDKVYLSELQRNEARLKAEIAKAAKRSRVSMNGFSAKRGHLPWPLKGRVLHHFGSSQAGLSKWKGIVISASYGQPVKAVDSGTIVFSDYLRGYGLVVLIDHGKGDMTLYGFNQTLLKKEGDKVTTGETIALAGDTGGQEQPSLYFEVRRNSKAQNPFSWLSK